MTTAPRMGTLLAVAALLSPLCLYPAFLNGAPLVFSDSASYLNTLRDAGLPPFYAAFIRVAGLAGRLEPVLAIQALLAAAAALWVLARVGGVTRTAVLVGLGAAAILLNQLPWLASWLMPDLFTGIGALALLLLLFVPERLPRIEQALLALTVFGCALMASASMPLYFGLLVFAVACRAILLRQRAATPAAGIVLVAILAAVLTTVAANRVLHGRWQLNSGGPALTFSRLVDTGVAQPIVARECRLRALAICPHQQLIGDPQRNRQVFLWEGPAEATEARTTSAHEYAELNALILKESWPAFIAHGVADTLLLLSRPTLVGSFYRKQEGVGVELEPRGDMSWALQYRYPTHLAAYRGARQQRGDWLEAFPARTFAISSFAGYALLALLALILFRTGDRVGAAIALSALALVAGELLLHATLVGPFARYHVKVAWVAWPLVLALLARLARRNAGARLAASPAT